MKRPVFALCASLLLLLGLMPGATLAGGAANLDQWNDPEVGHMDSEYADLAQTFTSGKTGLLVGVALNMYGNPTATIGVSILGTDGSRLPTGPALRSSGTVSVTSPDWYYFAFAQPLGVTSGTVYAIVFNTTGDGAVEGSTDTYPGGQALTAGPPWTALGDPGDFAFRTYVDTATAQLNWNQTQITAGTSTPLTLTATMTYVNGAEIVSYGNILAFDLPAWFAVSGITCPAAISLAHCNATDLAAGQLVPATDGGATLTFTLTGTANPALTDVADQATANGQSCLVWPAIDATQPNQPLDPGCTEGDAAVTVVAPAATPVPATPVPATPVPATPTPTPTKAPTPPPTSTGAGSASDNTGGTIWFLSFALVALFGGLLVLVDRRRQRIF
jgi:hypothetical protein